VVIVVVAVLVAFTVQHWCAWPAADRQTTGCTGRTDGTYVSLVLIVTALTVVVLVILDSYH